MYIDNNEYRLCFQTVYIIDYDRELQAIHNGSNDQTQNRIDEEEG